MARTDSPSSREALPDHDWALEFLDRYVEGIDDQRDPEATEPAAAPLGGRFDD